MSAEIMRPYMSAHPESIRVEEWVLGDGSPLDPDGQNYDWNGAVPISIRRGVRYDAELIAATARLPPGAILSLLPAWWCESTAKRGSGEPVHFQIGMGSAPCTLNLRISGDLISGSLRLRTLLLLKSLPVGLEADPLRAKRKGSILWEDSQLIRLGEDDPRFPVTGIDFTELGWSARSAWRLEVELHELDRPISSSIRLFLNKGHAAYPVLAAAADSESGHLRHGVAAELLSTALEHSDALERFKQAKFNTEGGEGDSLGDLLLSLLELALPGESPIRAAKLRRENPGAWHSAVQSAFRPWNNL